MKRRNIVCAELRRKIRKIFGERKYIFAEEKKNGEGKGGKYLEKENIFFLRRRIRTEKEKEKNIWRRKIHILRRRKMRKDKEENMFFLRRRRKKFRERKYIFCGGGDKRRRQWKKIFGREGGEEDGEGKYHG